MMVSNTDLTSRERRHRFLAALTSLVAGVGITALKFYAYSVTGSQGVYSDALESVVNILTAALALAVVYYSSKPVDVDHPYGHGKVEYFSAAFEGSLIALAALVIFYQAARAWWHDQPLQHLDTGMIYVGIAAVANLALGALLMSIGKQNNSTALVASAHHLFSDVWTSAGILGSLVVIELTGWTRLDVIAAVAVGAYLVYTGLRLVRQSIAGLLDEEDLDVLGELVKIFEKHVAEGIIQIHHTKVIRSGWFHHIDAHVVVPEFWTIDKAHEVLERFEQGVIHDYRYSGEANFHLDPCRRKYCVYCDYPACPIRQENFVKRMPVRLEYLRSKTEPHEHIETTRNR